MLHRIENRIKKRRGQDMVHELADAAQRKKLFATTAKLEKLLAETVAEEVSPVLEAFATEEARLKRMIPARKRYEDTGTKGSWLMFERPE